MTRCFFAAHAEHLSAMDTSHTTADNPWGLEPLLGIGELAHYLGIPVSTIYDWRTRGLGPRVYRFGKHLKFAVSDVRIWIEQQRDGAQISPPDAMSRPRLPIGTFGTIGFQTASTGRVTARARYRDWDGKSRHVQAAGGTKRAAEHALKAKLADRTLFQPAGIRLSADSPFRDLVTYWLEDLEIEDRLSKTTRQLYERNMRTLVMPAFKDLTLREIGVARCDHFLKHLAKQSYNRAEQARVVLRLALGLAVRHKVLHRNPMDHVSRLRRPVSTPNALTPAEVNAVRAAIDYWETGRSPS